MRLAPSDLTSQRTVLPPHPELVEGHGFDAEGKTVLKKELKRGQVASFFAKLDPCRIGLEACASAHYRAREIAKLGHDARLIPAQRSLSSGLTRG